MPKPTPLSSETIDPIDIMIGKRLKFRRNFMGMTQESLARLLGVSFQQIQKYESGQNKIAASKLYHIAKILSSPIQYFFEDESAAASAQHGMSDQAQDGFAYEDTVDTGESARALRAYSAIKDPKKRKIALDMLKGLQ